MVAPQISNGSQSTKNKHVVEEVGTENPINRLFNYMAGFRD